MADEYIKREAVLDIAMMYCPDDDGSCSKAGEDLRDMLDEIESIPAADVRPVVRGEWVWSKDKGIYYCSNCKAVSPREDQDGEYCDCPAFCHVCGADMRGDTDDS